jgi:hypothetical protein
MTYAQEHRLLLAQHDDAERALAVNGHRLAYWGNTGRFTRFDGGVSRPGRSQAGYCGCDRAGVEIGVMEPAWNLPGYPMRLWGTDVPCPRVRR